MNIRYLIIQLKTINSYTNNFNIILIMINSNKLKNSLLTYLPSILINTSQIHEKNNLIFRSAFDLPSSENIDFASYVKRVLKYTEAEATTVLCSLILLDYLIGKRKIYLSSSNLHKFFFISLFISLKYQEDILFSEKVYSKISGINSTEMSSLEKDFLEMIDYSFPVSINKVYDYYTKLIDKVK